ncbi:MAG TPA: hypothetical protein DC020_11665 [Flavobacterium sp.]|nr:MAG: hypothetical protein A2X07_03165 [Flavobacteria bacterium GWF1_32_7]HBD27460.1 hypothetical protein [Flavobacterium sp.]
MISLNLSGQILSPLHYDESPKKYVIPPVKERQQTIKKSNESDSNLVPFCDDLISYVKENYKTKQVVESYQLITSTWLKKVSAYSIENKIVVIAEIKLNEISLESKEYIFCEIPNENWNNFYYGTFDAMKTFGERFHIYILDYDCYCN